MKSITFSYNTFRTSFANSDQLNIFGDEDGYQGLTSYYLQFVFTGCPDSFD